MGDGTALKVVSEDGKKPVAEKVRRMKMHHAAGEIVSIDKEQSYESQGNDSVDDGAADTSPV